MKLEDMQFEGRGEFNDARLQAFMERIVNHLRGKPVSLLNFDDVRQRLNLHNEYYKGLQEVPLGRIVGSVGRYDDFTGSFLPRKGSMEERWSRIYALTTVQGLPPIELYKVDDVYFVKDGNHRVSVARRLDTPTIEAYVTELPTTIDLEPGMTLRDWHVADAHARFLEETNLDFTRPEHHPIRLTEPHRYDDLRVHIQIVRELAKHVRGVDLDFEGAAVRWYDLVYEPVIDLIYKYEILQHFPERTGTDLYVWIVDRMRHLIDHYGIDNISGKLRLSDAMKSYLETSEIPIPEGLLYEDDEPLV